MNDNSSKGYKYPGFIDGLKDSNMKSNRASLNVFWEQIQELLNYTFKEISSSLINKKNLSLLQETIKSILYELSTKNDKLYDITYYVKSGVLLEILIESNQKKINLDMAIRLSVRYLEITKITKDSRVKEVALRIANLIERIKENNKIYPGEFLKEKDPNFVSLKDYMINEG